MNKANLIVLAAAASFACGCASKEPGDDVPVPRGPSNTSSTLPSTTPGATAPQATAGGSGNNTGLPGSGDRTGGR